MVTGTSVGLSKSSEHDKTHLARALHRKLRRSGASPFAFTNASGTSFTMTKRSYHPPNGFFWISQMFLVFWDVLSALEKSTVPKLTCTLCLVAKTHFRDLRRVFWNNLCAGGKDRR